MINLRFKFSLFGFILLFLIGCKTSISDFSSYTNNSKDYLLVFRGSDHNGFLDGNSSRLYIKQFFSTPSWPIFMNYNVIPPVNKDPNQGYEEIVGAIQDISSKLYSDSTFILFIDSHGDDDGTCSTGTENLKAEDIIKALKDGLNKNPNTKVFKRFIIMNTSCHSGQLIGDFRTNKDTEHGSLFKEGIYIYDSDASELAYSAYTMELFVPMFVFLRQLQVRSCSNTKDNYENIYNSAKSHVQETFEKNLPYFRTENEKEKIKKDLKSCFSLYDREYDSFYTTPTFSDIVSIIARINERKNNTSMKVEFSDSSIRNKPIFPDIEGCK